jgi:HSP20 family protein
MGNMSVQSAVTQYQEETLPRWRNHPVLTISGKREEQSEEERGGYLVRERRSGSCRRSLQLPEGIDDDSIPARFENGVLEVSSQNGAAVQGP